MRLWVTRTEPGARATAERLAAMGHAPVVAPLLRIEPLAPVLDLDGVAALTFTSPNGVEAFARLSPRRDLPVFAVGDATAAAAAAAGFAAARSAGGDVHDLTELIAGARPPGPVLHAGAREPAGDLVGALGRRGISARTVAVYAAVPAPGEAGLQALAEGRLDGVLIHSPRAARRLVEAAPHARNLPAYCISPAATAPLIDAGFDRAVAAPFPDEASLLKLI